MVHASLMARNQQVDDTKVSASLDGRLGDSASESAQIYVDRTLGGCWAWHTFCLWFQTVCARICEQERSISRISVNLAEQKRGAAVSDGTKVSP